MMNYYPDQLRRIADMCEALDKVDGANVPETSGITMGFKNGIPVIDTEHGDVYGYLADEVGGSWSFYATKDNPYEKRGTGE